MMSHKVKVDDLQFPIGNDGEVVIADPLDVYVGVPPSNKNIRMIDLLIDQARLNNMELLSDFFTENAPSKSKILLKSIIGKKIIKLVRCSWEPYNDFDPEGLYSISKENFFRLTSGAVILYLDNESEIGIYSQEDINSIIVWPEKDNRGNKNGDYHMDDEDYTLIDNIKTEYTTLRDRELSYKKISSVKILKIAPKSEKHKSLFNEVGIILELENGEELVFSHNLIPSSDSFSITYKEKISKELLTQLEEFEVN